MQPSVSLNSDKSKEIRPIRTSLFVENKKVFYLFGGMTSCISEVICAPFDQVKVRMQLNSSAKSRFATTALHIWKQDGFLSLFRGLTPSCLRQASYGTMRFGLYGQLKESISKDPNNINLTQKLFCGIMSGSISAAVCNPIDLIKIRIQATNTIKILPLIASVYKDQGVFGFYRGFKINMIRSALVSGIGLGVYEQFKEIIHERNLMQDGIQVHILSSILSSMFACVASSPPDVVKSRIMNGQDITIRTSVKNIWIQEGISGFFKGLLPNYMRFGPSTIIQFVLLEKMLELWRIGIKH